MNHDVFKSYCDQIYIVTQHVVTRHIIQINNLIIEEFIQKKTRGKEKKKYPIFRIIDEWKDFFFFFPIQINFYLPIQFFIFILSGCLKIYMA